MRHTAPNKRALVKAGNKAAKNLKELVGHCEWCPFAYGDLIQHEIARGSQRLTARLDPSCSIIFCGECHQTIHGFAKKDQVLAGLAILYCSRTSDYDLKRFIEVECPTAPNRYTQREVDRWISLITHTAP